MLRGTRGKCRLANDTILHFKVVDRKHTDTYVTTKYISENNFFIQIDENVLYYIQNNSIQTSAT